MPRGVMPEGKTRTYRTIDERIAEIDKKIASYEEKIAAANIQRNSLLAKKNKPDLSEIGKLLEEKGLTTDDLLALINSDKKSEENS